MEAQKGGLVVQREGRAAGTKRRHRRECSEEASERCDFPFGAHRTVGEPVKI